MIDALRAWSSLPRVSAVLILAGAASWAHAAENAVCVTDKAPKPDEYKFLCQGLLAIRDLPINFTLLYNDGGKVDGGRVLSALKSIGIAGHT